MSRRAIGAAAMLALAGGAASAGPVRPDGYAPASSADVAAADEAAGGWDVGRFFYPAGYDPQYGSDGRLPDAASFAAGYGCRSIWNARLGRRVPACN